MKAAQEPDLSDISHEEIIPVLHVQQKDKVECNMTEMLRDSKTQTEHMPKYNINHLMFNASAMHFYTGLVDYEHFTSVLASLGPAASSLKYRWGTKPSMAVENQFRITLIKLRRHTTNFELAFWFESSEYTIANIFVTWVNFMYRQWKRTNIWPSVSLFLFTCHLILRENFSVPV